MGIVSILIIAVALGIDAFSVAAGIGAGKNQLARRSIFRLSFCFGLFQFMMPVIGWAAGRTVADYIAGYDHWMAFTLLAIVGLKMIKESFGSEQERADSDPTAGWTLIILSIATSIDALAVGLSFAFLKVDVLFASIVIGIICFFMTAVGIFFGRQLGRLFGKRAEIVGGFVLIGIGLKILVEHAM